MLVLNKRVVYIHNLSVINFLANPTFYTSTPNKQSSCIDEASEDTFHLCNEILYVCCIFFGSFLVDLASFRYSTFYFLSLWDFEGIILCWLKIIQPKSGSRCLQILYVNSTEYTELVWLVLMPARGRLFK